MDSISTRRNFLLATWEGGGSVGPMVTLARKLIDAGHDVRLMSDACNRPETEAVGARFVPWRRAPSRTDRFRDSELIRDWAASSSAEGFLDAIDKVFAGPALGYAQDVVEELEREAADLVVANDFLLGVMAGCESIAQPFVLMACNTILFPLDDAPLSGPGHDAALTAEERAQAEAMKADFRAVFDGGLPALNTARALLGLPPLASLLDQFAAARTTLIGISKHFDMAREPVPAGYRYVGPQIDEPAWTEPWRNPWTEDDARPMVLVSFSTTFQNHIGVLQRVIDGLAGLPVRALVTMGPTIKADDLVPAANTRLVPSAPHNQVMRHASVVITHGGHGTVSRAMVNRLPMLVMPHGRDQDGNAARVAAHGAGLTLAPSASADEIGDAVKRLMADTGFARAARELGDRVETEMQESDVVGELEDLCCRAMA